MLINKQLKDLDLTMRIYHKGILVKYINWGSLQNDGEIKIRLTDRTIKVSVYDLKNTQ
jgi:hypothetical protein